MLFFLQKPLQSLDSFDNDISNIHIHKYQDIINKQQSIILGLNVSQDLKRQILSKTGATWKQDDIWYLGMKEVAVRSGKFGDSEINVSPLIEKKTKRQLEAWDKLQLSWFGCFAAIKMKIVLQSLFCLSKSSTNYTSEDYIKFSRLLVNFSGEERNLE